MHLKNPSGKKHITIQNGETKEIFLEDLEPGSRVFDLKVELLGKNSTCHIRGRAQSYGNDCKQWKIQQIFKGTNQEASIDLRGTAEDESFLGFDGKGHLSRTSNQATANIEGKIILFDQAKGRLLPVLRVDTDRVKGASHGASIAPIDPEKILYFQSRGIPQKNAKNILKKGFLEL